MANVISLHSRQVFLSAGEPAAFGQAYFYETGTADQVSVYSDVDLLSERSQPVPLDADGVLPVCYIGSPDPLRILLTDEDDVALPGYPMDNIVPLAAEAAAANTIGFSPTDDIPETNVQAAIEAVAGLFSDQSALMGRPFTPYVTGGTSNAYTITPSPAITAYTAGQSFMVRPDRANTGAATLNINGLGARNLMKTDVSGTPVPLAASEIRAGREFMVHDDGTQLLITLGRDFTYSVVNANGVAVRFPDGTQICWKTLVGQGPVSLTYGSLVSSAAITVGSWAANFTVAPKTSYQIFSATSLSSWAAGASLPTASTGGSLLIVRVASSAATDFQIDVTAIGRWF